MGENQIKEQLHGLEEEFQMPAREILDVIMNSNRCRMNVRGAIAQEHLRRHLRVLFESGHLEAMESIDKDGQPDFRIRYKGRDFLIECKNVQKTTSREGETTVDFMRTRSPKAQPGFRYYSPDEFDILAACTFNQSRKWDFQFIRTMVLDRHPDYPDRLSNRVSLGPSRAYVHEWSTDLISVLDRFFE